MKWDSSPWRFLATLYVFPPWRVPCSPHPHPGRTRHLEGPTARRRSSTAPGGTRGQAPRHRACPACPPSRRIPRMFRSALGQSSRCFKNGSNGKKKKKKGSNGKFHIIWIRVKKKKRRWLEQALGTAGASRMWTGRWWTASRACGARPPSLQTRAAELGGTPRGHRGQRQMVWPRKAPTRLCAQAQLRPRPQAAALTQQNEATRRDPGGGNTGAARTVSSSSVLQGGNAQLLLP